MRQMHIDLCNVASWSQPIYIICLVKNILKNDFYKMSTKLSEELIYKCTEMDILI